MKNEQWILSKRPIGVPNLETDLTLKKIEIRDLNLITLML